MFEVGWTEMLVIAVVMIVVVGPKDLPRMLRTFGRMTSKMRGMASDFQKQFNEALKEAELDDVKKSVDEIRGLNPANEIRKHINPFEKAAADIRAGVDAAMKPKPAEVSPPADVHTADPLKNGATGMPGVEGPVAMPDELPLFPVDGSAPAAETSASEPTPPSVSAAESATPIVVPSTTPSLPLTAAAVGVPAAAAVAVAAKRAPKATKANVADKPAAAAKPKAKPAKSKAESDAPAKPARK
ncbi:MAG: twin-arginine translocase subunit TatB, partial [Rhizobiaceae bacterium]|nr:twin-arginine translocase subunit TatB [Rhizobiaceae bacterium]